VDVTKPAPEAPSRRGFLRRAGVTLGAAAVATPAFAGGARAQEGTDTTAGGATDTTAAGATTAAGTTTTTAPRRPEPEDLAFLSFAQSIELAIVQVYGQIVATGALDDETTKVIRVFQRQHQEYADAFAGMAGKAALSRVNPGYAEELSSQVDAAPDQQGLLEVAFEIENENAGMYVDALGSLVATEPAALVASIAPVSGRRTVVLGEALGLPLDEYVPITQSTAGVPRPSEYPLIEGEN
jgi:hypothetical protein